MVSRQDDWTFGELPEGEELPDFTPIEFKLIGYDKKTGAALDPFVFHASSTMPFGAAFDVFVNADAEGNVNVSMAASFLQACLVPEETELWENTIHDPEVHFLAPALTQMAGRFLNYYQDPEGSGSRPTQRQSAPPSTQRRTGGTTKAAHAGRATPSRASRSRTPSTAS